MQPPLGRDLGQKTTYVCSWMRKRSSSSHVMLCDAGNKLLVKYRQDGELRVAVEAFFFFLLGPSLTFLSGPDDTRRTSHLIPALVVGKSRLAAER